MSPIVASEVSLPKGDGRVRLLDVLPQELKDIYSHPNEQILRAEPERPAAPAAHSFTSEEEYIELRELSLQTARAHCH